MDPDIKHLVEWLVAFQACRSTAFHHCPEEVYATLRADGYLDQEHDVTDRGHSFIRGINDIQSNW